MTPTTLHKLVRILNLVLPVAVESVKQLEVRVHHFVQPLNESRERLATVRLQGQGQIILGLRL